MRARRKQLRQRRRGGATVELAILLPLILALIFGIIEFGWAFTVRQGLVNAAREGARMASMPGEATEDHDADIRSRVADYFDPMGLADAISVEITHGADGGVTEIVTVTIPFSEVTLTGDFFDFGNFNMSATCSMRKEGMDQGSS